MRETRHGGDDMYRAILQEIGAGEREMDYLFDDDDDDDDDAMVHQLKPVYPSQNKKNLSDDEQLLHQWESEIEDDVDGPEDTKYEREEGEGSNSRHIEKIGRAHV